jgi:hypothetical protein
MIVGLLTIYVAAELTPSSYALVLPVFGAAPTAVSWDESRETAQINGRCGRHTFRQRSGIISSGITKRLHIKRICEI